MTERQAKARSLVLVHRPYVHWLQHVRNLFKVYDYVAIVHGDENKPDVHAWYSRERYEREGPLKMWAKYLYVRHKYDHDKRCPTTRVVGSL